MYKTCAFTVIISSFLGLIHALIIMPLLTATMQHFCGEPIVPPAISRGCIATVSPLIQTDVILPDPSDMREIETVC